MAKNLARAAVLAASLYLSACESPNEPIKPIEPPKPKPSISLTAALASNGIDIGLNANYKNLKEPRINVSKNGNQILSRTLSESDTAYSETLSYSTNNEITKGNYGITLNGKTLEGRDTSITASAIVPNYKPTANFTGLQTTMDEGAEVNVSLEGKFADKNPEDIPVPTPISATSPDGKVEATLNGYNLRIKSLPDKIGNYSVALLFGSDAGEKKHCKSFRNNREPP